MDIQAKLTKPSRNILIKIRSSEPCYKKTTICNMQTMKTYISLRRCAHTFVYHGSDSQILDLGDQKLDESIMYYLK